MKPFERVAFDLIPMEEAYNSDKWISHLYCVLMKINLLDTHRSKGECNDVLEKFINTISTRFGHTVKFIKIDDKQSLGGRYRDFLATTGITSERTAPYSPQQNSSAKRSGGVLTIKARCIYSLAGLPIALWPEIYCVTAYLLNRTPTRLLTCVSLPWRLPIEEPCRCSV